MMEANTLSRPRQPKRPAIGLAMWGIGGAVVGFALPSAMIFFVGLAGMAVIIGLGYDQTIGAPIYVALFIFGIIAYALIVRFGIRRLGRRHPVPWVVWPALAAFPLAWTALSLTSAWRGMLSPAVSVLAGLGLLLAWLSIRVDRTRLAPAVSGDAPYGSPSEAVSASNDPGR